MANLRQAPSAETILRSCLYNTDAGLTQKSQKPIMQGN